MLNDLTTIKLQNENYKCGNYEKALEDSFIGFDATLVDRKVVAELKVIAGNSEDKVKIYKKKCSISKLYIIIKRNIEVMK